MAKSYVIIRFAPAAPAIGTAAQLTQKGGPVDALEVEFGVRLKPVFESFAGGRLGSYYQAEVETKNQAKQLADALDKSPLVEKAYVRATYAGPHKTGDDANGTEANGEKDRRKQAYLRPGPTGINAFYAWDHERARGQNVKISDVEEGWDLSHEDLPSGLNVIGMNGLGNAERAHGLAVLGVIAARDSQSGLIGISPQVKTIPISHYRDPNDVFNLVWAMEQALDERLAPHNLGPGDILLIEAEAHQEGEVKLPVEVEDHVFDAIQHVTGEGILVIEPAGNSVTNLDELKDLRDDLGVPRDSGALIVSGTIPEKIRKQATDEYPEMRHRCKGAECAYGARVNCFAWGKDIQTLGDSQFGGTSGASAIIAGAAALLQAVARRELKEQNKATPYLTPSELRDILRFRGDDLPATATLRPTLNVDANEYPIGVMPDLEEVIGRFLASIGIVRAKAKRGGKHKVPAKKLKGKPALKNAAKTGKKKPVKVAKKTKASKKKTARGRTTKPARKR